MRGLSERDGPVRIEIAPEQGCLEKEHGRKPDRGGPSEPGEDHLGDHGLDLEEQEGAQEYGQGKKEHGEAEL